jgi:hypothetical protein
MSFKKIAILIAIILVFTEGYLITSSITENEKDKAETKRFCSARCNQDGGNFLWEFSGENNISKGFTTREECLSYCDRSKHGFVYNFLNSSKSSLGGLLNAFSQK